MKGNDKFQGGVLAIGSLYWENKENCIPGKEKLAKCREKWRKRSFLKDTTFDVKLPIRYGRKSFTRKNTYTMAFSNKLDFMAIKLTQFFTNI